MALKHSADQTQMRSRSGRRLSRVPGTEVSTEPRPAIEAALFQDWKSFCVVLREIARGDEAGRPLPSFEAQKRAQAVLTERGCTWPSSPATFNFFVVRNG